MLLLEAGGERPIPGEPDILAAEIAQPAWHDPANIISAAALGGTSHWWGGRAVPFDVADFATWPISYDEAKPWLERAGAFLGARGICGSAPPPLFAQLQDFDAEREETWCPQINMAKRWRAPLGSSANLAVLLNARATAIDCEAGAVRTLHVHVAGARRTARAAHYVLACGGLGVLRLLLLAQRAGASHFGGDLLGSGYMGHLTGVIADLAPANPADADAFAYRPLGDNVFARRRITARAALLAREHLPNIAFWIDSAANDDPAHGSAVASAKYVAARAARALLSRNAKSADAPLKLHFDNIARAPVSAALGLGHALYLNAATQLTGRLPRPRRFIPASTGAWSMRYHAEQPPHARNRVTLAQSQDSLGLPRLAIAFDFSADDCEAVVRAHDRLAQDLTRSGAGALHWRTERATAVEMVSQFARDGYHQLGGAIMGADPKTSVVDAHCRVHELGNLWLASSATFPTGGQANPTLMITALSLRLAHHLAALRRAA